MIKFDIIEWTLYGGGSGPVVIEFVQEDHK